MLCEGGGVLGDGGDVRAGGACMFVCGVVYICSGREGSVRMAAAMPMAARRGHTS